MKKKSKAIMLGVTSNLIYAAANVILNVEKTNPGLFDVFIIYHMADDLIDERDMAAMEQLGYNVEFRSYSLPNESFGFKHGLSSYPPIIYSKFEMFDLLNEYEFVLWLDTDILVRGDISHILDCKDIAWRPAVLRPAKQLEYPGLSLEGATKPNCGVIAIKRNEQTLKISSDDAYEIVPTVPRLKIGGGYDEMVFCLLAVKFGLEVLELSVIYNNVLQMNNSSAEPVIVHAMGPKKFWNDKILRTLYPQWQQADTKWREAGGLSYTKGDVVCPNNSTQLFRHILWMDYWSGIIDKNCIVHKYGMEMEEYTKYFVQIYLKNIDHSIHYEFISRQSDVIQLKANNMITVALHIENKKYLNEFVFYFVQKYFGHYKADMNDKKMYFEYTCLPEKAMSFMCKLIDDTYDFLISVYG